MNTETGTIRLINHSKCRRELLVDEQTYFDADGKVLKDINGRAMQPKVVSVMLEQGANFVDATFLAKVRATKRRDIEVLFDRRILRVEPVLETTIDVKDLKGMHPEGVRDLSELTVAAAAKIIAACNNPQRLREFVDHDPRPAVRALLRERYAEIVPKDEPGIDPTESY
jgi:hypothetical protein